MAEKLRLFPALLTLGLALIFPPLLRASASPVAAESALDFDLPADHAEAALRKFGRQSGLQILFPTDLARDLRTRAVVGRFTPRAALDQLLGGTPLSATFDAASGTFILSRGDPLRLIELPPYVVEGSAYPPWSYAQLPGFEVLSRCSDDASEKLITDSCRLLDLLDELLLPRSLQVRHDIPTCFVLYDEAAQPAVAREFIAEIQRRETSRALADVAHGSADVLVRALPNYRFWDRDSLTIYYLRGEYEPPIPQQTLSPAYLEYLLRNRTPSLPPWFIEGMLEFYRSVDLSTGGSDSLSPSTAELSRYARQADAGAIVRPVEWISPAVTATLRKRNGDFAATQLPAAAALFAEFPADGTPENRQLWRAHGALFIRWALSDPKHARRSALWKLADRASAQPVTEELFRQCFGLSYANLDRQLADTLRSAVKDTLTLRPARPFPTPAIKFRAATDSEVSRLQGGLNYLEVAYAQEFFPDLKPRYLAQARHTLHRAYDNGDRDPRLLALLGLCECDAGEDAIARPLLEAAVRAGVVRPRAYYELARIRFEALRAANPATLLTFAQAVELLRPLHQACRQSPPLAEVYDLIAFIWLNTDTPLTLAELAVLDEGIARFPRRVRLLHSTALLNARQGYAAAAQKLLTRALAVATDPEDKARLLSFQASLSAK